MTDKPQQPNRFGTPLSEALKTQSFKKFELVNLGASGSGKTTRSLTATQFGPALFMDFDGKFQGVLRSIPELLKPEIKLDNIIIKECRDIEYKELLEYIIDLTKASDKGELPFATIVQDTFTNFSEIVYKSIFTSEDLLFRSDAMQLWGKVGHRTSELMKLLQGLPCNIIINCHVKLSENGVPEGPAGKGGFRDLLKARVTDMHYVALESGKNMVRVKNSSLPPVNTNIDPKYIDPKGFATKFGLSVFEDYAFKK